jgi:LPXTG-motif cell wall-anchored protein
VFISYEYRWVDEPETIEVPDQYGPVEYHNTSARSPVLHGLIIGAALIVIVTVVLLRKRRKK